MRVCVRQLVAVAVVRRKSVRQFWLALRKLLVPSLSARRKLRRRRSMSIEVRIARFAQFIHMEASLHVHGRPFRVPYSHYCFWGCRVVGHPQQGTEWLIYVADSIRRRRGLVVLQAMLCLVIHVSTAIYFLAVCFLVRLRGVDKVLRSASWRAQVWRPVCSVGGRIAPCGYRYGTARMQRTASECPCITCVWAVWP